MTKSYTLEEIHQNRLRIKSIPKNLKFLEIYKICASFGEIMFFDVLSCSRPLVYASFVNRKDAFAALQQINDTTLMVAAFSNETSNNFSDDQVFVLDLTGFDEFEKNRFAKKKQIRVRTRKNRNFKTKQFEKNFDVYPDYISTDSNSEVLVNDEEIIQLMADEHKLVSSLSTLDLTESKSDGRSRITHSLNDWESEDSLFVSSNSVESLEPSSLEIIEKNDDFSDEEDEAQNSEGSFTSWSVFNGQPKDWSKLRMPSKKPVWDYFPSLKKSF